jgi:CheY-like chemotaxis protein
MIESEFCVLLVEDEKEIRRFVRQAPQGEGCLVRVPEQTVLGGRIVSTGARLNSAQPLG